MNMIEQKTLESPNLKKKILHLEEKLAHQKSQLKDLATVGAVITSILDLDRVLTVLMEMGIEMVDGEVGAIVVLGSGEQTIKANWGLDEKTLFALKLSNGYDIPEWTLKSGKTFLLNQSPAEAISSLVSTGSPSPAVPLKVNLPPGEVTTSKIRINSVLSVPIKTKEKTTGVLVIINKRSGEIFTPEDQFNLEMLVNFAAVAIENSQLLKESLKKQKLEQQLDIARQVQQALLPSLEPTSISGASVKALYRPAYQVGGDFYDIILNSDRDFVVAVGDVSNKGMPAALMMTAVRAMIRSEVKNRRKVKDIIQRINTFLCEDMARYKDMFVTLFYGHFDLDSGCLSYSNAGHLPPIMVSGEDNSLEFLTQGGVILGQFEDFDFKQKTIQINKNDHFLFYTDGVTECTNQQKQLFGKDRLVELVQRNLIKNHEDFLEILENRLGEFSQKAPDQDDMTAVLIKISD